MRQHQYKNINLTFLLKRTLYLSFSGGLVLFIASIAHAEQIEFVGPQYYLEYMQYGMKIYYEKHGIYADDLAKLEAIYNNDYEVVSSKGSNYSYKIPESDEKSYRIITENKDNLINFEITNLMKYPMWYFKTENERQKKKAEVLYLFSISDHIQKQSCLVNLRYFPGKDVQFFLINVLESRDEDLTMKVGAINTLNVIVEEKDLYLLEDIIKIITLENLNVILKRRILNTFSIINHPDVLPTLRKLLKTEKEDPTYKIKAQIKKLIQKIEEQ